MEKKLYWVNIIGMYEVEAESEQDAITKVDAGQGKLTYQDAYEAGERNAKV